MNKGCGVGLNATFAEKEHAMVGGAGRGIEVSMGTVLNDVFFSSTNDFS